MDNLTGKQFIVTPIKRTYVEKPRVPSKASYQPKIKRLKPLPQYDTDN